MFDAVDEQLAQQPTIETRNRKPMRPNPLAPWEFRAGEIRVYYDVEEKPGKLVVILAVGIKDRSRIMIGESPSDAADNDPRKIIAETIGYLQNNAPRMDYPAYRREGLPVTRP